MSISYGGDNIQDTDGGVLRPSSSVMRNRIINGAMVVAQRGTSAVTTDGSFPVDRFYINQNNDGAFSAQQDSEAPIGFTKSLKVTTTTADSSLTGVQNLAIVQRIEGYNIADLGFGTANAKNVTLSFWVRSSLTGTFGGSLRNSASDRSYPFTYTISSANTWTQASVTIAGDTTGTWLTDNGVGIQVAFGLGAGPDRSGIAGSWASANYFSVTGAVSVIGTLNATFYITGVQLEVGSSATGFEYVNYQTSLANCQRYYTKITAGGAYTAFGAAACTGSTTGNVCINWPVSMRATPTISWANCGINNPSQIALTSSSAPTSYYAGSNSGFCSFTVASGLTANGAAMFNANNSTSAYVDVTAEL